MEVALVMKDEGLTLVGEGLELRGDFTRMIPRIRQGRLQKELLVRAARVKGVAAPVAVDATAGLGEDALLLAAAGFTVTMFERDATIAALLKDAMKRGRDVPALAPCLQRMELVECDSIRGMPNLASSPDVIFLDPMFPQRKKSAAVKKKLQLIQAVEKPCEDEGALMDAARAARPRKIVIKRPLKGPVLAGVKPSYAIAGKAVRYDVVMPAI